MSGERLQDHWSSGVGLSCCGSYTFIVYTSTLQSLARLSVCAGLLEHSLLTFMISTHFSLSLFKVLFTYVELLPRLYHSEDYKNLSWM